MGKYHRISRHYRAILVVAIVVSALCFGLARKLRLNTSMVSLLPDDTPSVVELNRVSDKIGGVGEAQIMVRSPDPKQSIAYAESILLAVRALPWVENARMGADTRFFDEHRLLYIDLEDLKTIEERVLARITYETLHAQPFYIDLEEEPPPSLDFTDIEQKYKKTGSRARSKVYQNKDGTIVLILIQPKGIASNMTFAKKVQRDLNELVAATKPAEFHPAMQVEVGGSYRSRVDEFDTIINDVTSSSLIVGLMIVVLITLYFRHPLGAVAVLVPLAMSLLWTFALSYLVIGTLNLVTVFLIVVLMGLGIDFGIHMLTRFQSERAHGASLEVALERMFHRAGRASLTAALTTAACFWALLATEFRGFVEFGIIAGSGLLLSAVAYFTVLPALLTAIARRNWMLPRLRSPKDLEPISPWWNRRRARILLVLGACIVGGSFFIGRNASFEYDLRQLRAKVPSTREFNRRVRQVFPERRDPAAILVEDDQTAMALASELQRRKEATSPNSPINNVLYLKGLMPKDQDAKLTIIENLNAKLDELFDVLSTSEQKTFADIRKELQVRRIESTKDLPIHIRERFFGRPTPPGQLVYVYQSGSLGDLKVAKVFHDAVDHLTVDGRSYQAISEPLIYVAMFDLLLHDTPRALFLSATALLFLLFLDFRSVRSVCIVLVPLLSGLGILVAAMVLIPVRLNFLNAVVLPSILGLGVDGGVHMYHSIVERGVGNLSRVQRETGRAVAVCTLTSLLGFAGMLVADHPGLRSIGMLALVGLLGCLFGALVILPALLGSYRKT